MMKRGEPISQEQFEKNWRQVKYQLELEGFNVTEEDQEAVRKVTMGEMPREQLVEDLMKNR
ncbi:hypothetical protein [Virgibacillus sp. DJP39]|uniref:hypothetical protein n=1 Tax=Virgibacillus sp. DJP39 TaxID=3409790 RepID=UPI003BB516A6